MPRITKKTASGFKPASEDHEQNHTEHEDNMPDSPTSSAAGDAPVVKQSHKKRAYGDGEEQDFSSEMQKMLECFGADMTKTVMAKRKRLEKFTDTSIKTSNRKVEEIWKCQQNERQKLHDEYKKQVGAVFHQWESDLDKTKDQEEKFQALFRQQQKLFQQTRVVQSQRLKTIRQLQEQYTKGLEALEKCHNDQQSTVQSELKEELQLLQKKILMDTQQQEMANVLKSLQTMLF